MSYYTLGRRRSFRNHQRGLSLAETLIASALLMFVAIGLIPILTRSAQNNISGLDSNRASHHARSELDGNLALEFNNPRFDLRTPLAGHTIEASSVGVGGEQMIVSDTYWDDGAKASVPSDTKRRCNEIRGTTPHAMDGDSQCIKLGDGGWVGGAGGAKGFVLWRRRDVIRNFAYADISDGVISQSGTELVTLGHSQLLDRPLLSSDPPSRVQLSEQTVELVSERAGGVAEVVPDGEPDHRQGTSLALGPGSQRMRIFRSF